MADWIRKHPLAVAALLLLLAGAGGLILLVGVRDGFSPPEEVLLWPSGAPGHSGPKPPTVPASPYICRLAGDRPARE